RTTTSAPHNASGDRSVNELVTADRDGEMRRAGLSRREEDQVARLQILRLHRFSRSILIAHGARQRYAVLCEHVLCEAAAIEAGGIAAAVAIRRAAQRERAARQRVAIERQVRRRG